MAATPNPKKESNPAMITKRIDPAGTHMGLEIIIKGTKKIRPRTMAVRVRPVRRSRMPPDITKVKNPMSWVE